MDFEIIDFHTHPFMHENNNICSHTEYCNMSADRTVEIFKNLGVSRICGSVIDMKNTYESYLCKMKANNDEALRLRNYYKGFYVPGFHVHPDYVEESINEIRRMNKEGVKLMGELVPYADGWDDYSCEAFSEILDEAAKYNMVVNLHSMSLDAMDKMVERHKDIVFVAAHPGEYDDVMRHLERMKMSENYYIDVSGYGIFRYGMLKHVVDCFGADRVLFGSDYPTCNPGMYIGGVLFDELLSDTEKEKIFSLNAKRLLGI